jgi:hypothetical protein
LEVLPTLLITTQRGVMTDSDISFPALADKLVSKNRVPEQLKPFLHKPFGWTTSAIMARAFAQGKFFCTTLPHWRYDGIKRNCYMLQDAGMLEKTGRKYNAVILKPTMLAHE